MGRDRCWGWLLAAPAAASRTGWPSRSDAFRTQIEIVVIDPSAPYASGIRAALPDARSRSTSGIWSRSPTTWSPRSGNASPATCSAAAARIADPVWVNRRLLLTGAEHLSAKQWRRLSRMLDGCRPDR